jgi:hypothetical protein
MIIRPAGASLVLITQPDHAALAARIMDEWRADGFPHHPRRAAIGQAIVEHDNGWRAVDAAPLLDDTGKPLDFITAPAEVRQAIWPRGVAHLAGDPVAAALVAEHALVIYERFRPDQRWAPFFSQMTGLRNEHAARAGLSLETLARDYFFLRAADLMSLTFCNAWAEPQTIGEYSFRLHGDTLGVSPDPFEGASVVLEVPGRRLPDRRFQSRDEAKAEFDRAGVVTIRGVAVGRSDGVGG